MVKYKTKYLGLRIDEALFDSLQDEADRKKLKSVSDLVRQKLAVLVDFDEGASRFVEDYSQAMGIPPYLFINCIIVDYAARLEARRQVFGYYEPRILYQFIQTDKGMLRGLPLFENLFNRHVREAEDERVRALEIKQEHVDLNDEEKEFMKSRRR